MSNEQQFIHAMFNTTTGIPNIPSSYQMYNNSQINDGVGNSFQSRTGSCMSPSKQQQYYKSLPQKLSYLAGVGNIASENPKSTSPSCRTLYSS